MFSSVVDFGSRNPIPYESGPMAHHSMRAELYEIQKADLGRKYARVDRRPLDPPPVVLLKFYQALPESDTQQEVEQEISSYDEVQNVGLICSVDLFPVPPPRGFEQEQRQKRNSWGGGSSSSGSSTPVSLYNGSDGRLGSDSLPPPSISSSAASVPGDIDPEDVIHYVNTHPIKEESKVTPSLVGNTVVQPNVVEYQGKKALVFVFPDLAVKSEGHFILRYRVFDLYARKKDPSDNTERASMQAECYGGPFRVYSTKEFPGLNASTELTKHLARWGVRLNIRETERRRRNTKKGQGSEADLDPLYTTSALTTMPRKRKSGDAGADEDGYESDD